jgi:hypothetical protein
MYRLVDLKVEHVNQLLMEKMNENEDTPAEYVVAQPWSKALFVGDQLMVTGGVIPYWENRAAIWTLFSEESRYNFYPVFKGLKRYLNYVPFKRLEMYVPFGLDQAVRRAKLLGFEVDCFRARKFLSDGRDATLLSLVR